MTEWDGDHPSHPGTSVRIPSVDQEHPSGQCAELRTADRVDDVQAIEVETRRHAARANKRLLTPGFTESQIAVRDAATANVVDLETDVTRFREREAQIRHALERIRPCAETRELHTRRWISDPGYSR